MGRQRKPVMPVDRKAARAALFANDKYRVLYEMAEGDQRIGPDAPGDGDIVLWVSLVLSLLLIDFHEVDKTTPFPRPPASD